MCSLLITQACFSTIVITLKSSPTTREKVSVQQNVGHAACVSAMGHLGPSDMKEGNKVKKIYYQDAKAKCWHFVFVSLF